MRAALVLVAACSFSVSGPSHTPQRGGPPVNCTEGALGRAILDLGGVAIAAVIANFAYKAEFAHEEDTDHPAKAAPYIGIAVVYAGAVVYNFVQTARCRHAKIEWHRLQSAPP